MPGDGSIRTGAAGYRVAVLPTGAGKSAIYQVVGLRVDGPVLVVSALVALQRDQRDGLADTDAPDAVVVNSSQRVGEIADAWSRSCIWSVLPNPQQTSGHGRAAIGHLGRVRRRQDHRVR